MEFKFRRDEHGFVHAQVQDLPFLQDVLDDGLSCYPPVSATVPGPCTYMLDLVEKRLEQGPRTDADICGGNVSYLDWEGDLVYAYIDYLPQEPRDGDRVRVGEMLKLLRAYRSEIERSWRTAHRPFPQTHGKNPYPDFPWTPAMSPPPLEDLVHVATAHHGRS